MIQISTSTCIIIVVQIITSKQCEREMMICGKAEACKDYQKKSEKSYFSQSSYHRHAYNMSMIRKHRPSRAKYNCKEETKVVCPDTLGTQLPLT